LITLINFIFVNSIPYEDEYGKEAWVKRILSFNKSTILLLPSEVKDYKWFQEMRGWTQFQYIAPPRSLVKFYDREGKKAIQPRCPIHFFLHGFNLRSDMMSFDVVTQTLVSYVEVQSERVLRKRASTASIFDDEAVEAGDGCNDEDVEAGDGENAKTVTGTGSKTRSGKMFRPENIVPMINETLTSHAEPTNSSGFIVIANSGGTSFISMGQQTQEEILELYSDRVVTIA
jgi:hypothetical protein